MSTLFEIAAKLQAEGAPAEMLLVIAKGTLILAIGRLLLIAIPHASAAVKHLIAMSFLIVAGLVPIFSVMMPAWEIAVASRAAQPEVVEAAPAPARVGVLDIEPAAESDGTTTLGTALSIARFTGVVPEEPLSAVERMANVGRATWQGGIVLFVALVAMAMLAQILIGIGGVWYVARHSEPVTAPESLAQLEKACAELGLTRSVRLLVSRHVAVPVIWGVTRPVLLLPTEAAAWSGERLRVVLLHELAHLKRFDGASLIATRAALALWWYHPLAWSLERAGRRECERACDDLVLGRGTRPADYADHLLAIAQSTPTFDPFRAVTLAMSRKSQLEGRLVSILRPHTTRGMLTARSILLGSAAAVIIAIPVSSVRLTAAPPGEKQPVKVEAKASESEVTVVSDIEAIESFIFAKLGKWDKRADRWAREPRNAEERYERAWALYQAERYAEAAEAFKASAAEGYTVSRSLYNAACSYSLIGDAPRATRTLSEAIHAGWDDFDHIADDSDFDPIRTDPGFQRLLSREGKHVAVQRLNDAMSRYEALNEGKPLPPRKTDGATDLALITGAIAGLFGHEGDGDDWFDVGLDLLRLRQLDQSIQAFENSIRAGEKVGTSMYNIACAYSLKGEAGNGIEWLDKAVENGFHGDEKLANDPDIALLRQDGRFDEIRKKAADLQMQGCCDHKKDGANWQEVVDHHRKITDRYPDSGRAWFNLGYTSLQAQQHRIAIDAFGRAIALGYRPGTSSYNIACAYALSGNHDAAFQWLDKSKQHGFELADHARGDRDLKSLHDDPRWDSLLAELKRR
jgi:beta-lactamase regulating signal transducer with metallopeptidase domain